MPAAVVFDLDGTLACLPINWEALYEEFRRIMHVDVVRPLVDVVSRADAQTRWEVFAAWDKAELAIFDGATLCGEGMHVYQEFADKPKALVTLQGRAVVEKLVAKFGLEFNVSVTREDSLFRSDQLKIAAEKLGVPVSEVLFVGNTDTDKIAAEKVGCKFQRVQ